MKLKNLKVKIFKFLLVLFLFIFQANLFAQKRDFEEERRNILKNQKTKIIIQCNSIEGKPSVVYMNPEITSDSYRDNVGTSWSFFVHSVQIIGKQIFFKGHLITPRGGHQPEIGYIDPIFWECVNSN